MRVCWTVLILLGCRLSRASQSQNTSTCAEELRTRCESGGLNVTVPCPNMTSLADIRFQLYRGHEAVSSVTCSRKNGTVSCEQSRGVVTSATENNLSFSFVLADSGRGTYTCEGIILFPPPFVTVRSLTRVEVVEGCHSKSIRLEKPSQDFVRIWIMVVSLLTIYSITVTVATFVVWMKLRRSDSQSDYMNTKPRAPRDCRKRGVRNPMPRYI